MARAYEEWFAGYAEEPAQLLERCFEEIADYDEIVLLRDIRFESHCEHHMASVIGRAHIAYLPDRRVTSRMLGAFRDTAETRQEVLAAIGLRPGGGQDGAAADEMMPAINERDCCPW